MRFSLRTLMAATAVVALVCCVFFALPSWLAAVIFYLSAIFLPVLAISAVVFTRGYWRAFGVGSLVLVGFWPLLSGYYMLVLAFSGGFSSVDFGDFGIATNDITGMKIGFAVSYVLVAMAGLTSVGVRLLAVRSQVRTRRAKLAAAAASEPSRPQRYDVFSGRMTTMKSEPTAFPDPFSESL